MIGLKDLGKLYNILLEFGIMTVVEFLKWLGQYLILKHVFAIAMMFFKHTLSLIIHLRYLHKSLLGPGANILLHLTIVLVNSSSANNIHNDEVYVVATTHHLRTNDLTTSKALQWAIK